MRSGTLRMPSHTSQRTKPSARSCASGAHTMTVHQTSPAPTSTYMKSYLLLHATLVLTELPCLSL